MTDSRDPKPHESTPDIYRSLLAPKSLIETIKSFKDKKIPAKIQEKLLLQSYEKHHKKKLFGLRRATGITGTDKDGKTPLIHAVLSGDADTVRWLCDYQAGRDRKHQDPNADHLDHAGKNALMYAIIKGDFEMVKILAPMTNRMQVSKEDKMVPLGYVIQAQNATLEMEEEFTQNIRYEVDKHGILLALVRCQRADDLKELTKWVFCEVAKSIDERDLEKTLKKAGKNLSLNSSLRGILYVEAFLFTQYVQSIEPRNRVVSEDVTSEEVVGGKAASYTHYEYLCLRILDLAIEQKKFDVIENLVSSSIQSDYNIERPKIKGKWGGEENQPDQNRIWSDLLDHAIQQGEDVLSAESQADQTKEFGKIYAFIKYFLQLASKQKNAVFLHNENWNQFKEHIISHARQKLDTEMLRLIQPYFKNTLMIEEPRFTHAGKDTLQSMSNPQDSYKAFQRYQKKQEQQQHTSDDSSSDSEGQHHTSRKI